MRTHYTGIWRLKGVNKLAEGSASYTVAEMPERGLTAKIVADPGPYFYHVDRAIAVVHAFATGGMNNLESHNLSVLGADIRSRRPTAADGAYLVLEINGPGGKIDPKYRRDLDGYAVCFDAVDKGGLRKSLQPFVSALLSAIAINLGSSADRSFEKVNDVVYLTEGEESPPIYTVSIEAGNARISIASPFDTTMALAVSRDAAKMIGDSSIKSSMRLLVNSLDRKTEALQGFLDAWTALEIFTNKTFGDRYEGHWYEALKNETPAPTAPVVAKVRATMNDKYTLADKFLIIAASLAPEAAEEDHEAFKRFKRVRDRMMHGEEIFDPFPTPDIQKLLERYLRLHVQQ